MVANNTSNENARSLKLLGRLLPVNTHKACFLWWGRNKKSWAANRCFNGMSKNCEGCPHGYRRCQSEIAAHQRNQSEENMSHSSGAATGGQYAPPLLAGTDLLRAAMLAVSPQPMVWLTRIERTWVQVAVGTVGTRRFSVYLKWSLCRFTYCMCSFESNVAYFP